MIEKARESLRKTVKQGTGDLFNNLNNPFGNTLQNHRWHLVKRLPNGQRARTDWRHPDDSDINTNLLEPGRMTEALLLHEMGHTAWHRVPHPGLGILWRQIKVLGGWQPWGPKVHKTYQDLKLNGGLDSGDDPAGYQAEIAQYGTVVTYP